MPLECIADNPDSFASVLRKPGALSCSSRAPYSMTMTPSPASTTATTCLRCCPCSRSPYSRSYTGPTPRVHRNQREAQECNTLDAAVAECERNGTRCSLPHGPALLATRQGLIRLGDLLDNDDDEQDADPRDLQLGDEHVEPQTFDACCSPIKYDDVHATRALASLDDSRRLDAAAARRGQARSRSQSSELFRS